MKLLRKRVIGAAEDPLLIRYVVFRCAAFGIYVHHLMRSDHDRSLHDHPWPFVSVVLKGGYREVHDQTLDGHTVIIEHKPGAVLVRPAEWRHRFMLTRPAWTLVVVGRRARRWGFFTPGGWCWWRKYNPATALCEEDVLWQEGED